MMKFFGNKSSPIGLDIGSHSIKAVQLKRSGSAWTTSASVCLERATPGAAIDLMEMHRVADVLDRRGFVGREVVVSVPTDRLMTSVLELPPRVEGVPIDQIAKLEFARIHKQDPSALTISTWDLPAAARASKTSHVMAVGYLSAQADTFLQPIEDAGLTIVAMDEQSSARARACVSPEAGPAGMTAILDLSWTAGTLSVVKNNKIVYGRSIYEAGLQRLREAMSKSVADNPDLISYMLGTAGLNETPETAHGDIADLRDQINSHLSNLASEMRQALGYSAHQYPDTPIGMLLLVGGGAMVPGVAEHLEKSLEIMTRVARTIAMPSGDNAMFMQALGLAMFPVK